MTTTQPAHRGNRTTRIRRATAHPLAHLAAMGVVVVVCSGFSIDPRDWMKDGVDALFMSVAGEFGWLAEQMLLGAFDGQLGTLGAAEWSIATLFTGRLGAVMGIFAVAFCIIEVVAGMVGRDPTRIAKGAGIALLAWPLTATAAWVTIKLTTATDRLATLMLADSPADVVAAKMFAPLKALMTAGGPGASGIIAVVFAFLVLLPTVMLSLVMAFRSFALLIAVAFAPVALMTQGWSKMRGMARGWATIVGALVITKPLAAGIVVICLELIDQLPDLGGLLMGVVGLWMAAFAPAAAAGLFGFAGGEVAAAQGAASAQAGRHMVGLGKATVSKAAHKGADAAIGKFGPMAAASFSSSFGSKPSGAGEGTGGVKPPQPGGDDGGSTPPTNAGAASPGTNSGTGGAGPAPSAGAGAGTKQGTNTTSKGAPAPSGSTNPVPNAAPAGAHATNTVAGASSASANSAPAPAPAGASAPHQGADAAAGAPAAAHSPGAVPPPSGAPVPSGTPATAPGPGGGATLPLSGSAPAAAPTPAPAALGGTGSSVPVAPGTGGITTSPGGASTTTTTTASSPGTSTGAGAAPAPTPGAPATSPATPTPATPGHVSTTAPVGGGAGDGVVDAIVSSVEQQGDNK